MYPLDKCNFAPSEMQGAFLPITLEGNQSPDVAEEAHISGEADAEGEPWFSPDYEL